MSGILVNRNSLDPIRILKLLQWRLGYAIRETGQALERTGSRLQGIYSFNEKLNRHQPLLNVQMYAPTVGKNTFIAPTALVVGPAEIGDNVSIWYNASIRGDLVRTTIGHGSNIQDGALVGSLKNEGPETRIGRNVSVGHKAFIRGSVVEDNCLIGISAIIPDKCRVQTGAIVAAGAVLAEGTIVPSGELWGGNPAKKLRDLKPEEKTYLKTLHLRYQELGHEHNEILKLMRAKMEEYTK